MANTRRVSKLELALTPKQQVLLWLREEHQGKTFSDFSRHLLHLSRGAAPRTKIGRQVATSIRAAMKGEDPREIASAVRQGQMEADYLILLINRTNLAILEEKQIRWLKILLLHEKCRTFASSEDSSEDWDRWEQFMRATAIEMEGTQAAANAIQEQYFEGQELLLQDVGDALEEQVGVMRRMIKAHDTILADVGDSEFVIGGPEFQSAVEKVASEKRNFIVALAMSQMLEDFGEPDAADAAVRPHFVKALSQPEVEHETT